MKAYKKSIDELKKELSNRLGGRIDSVVLFGSAARGWYRPLESDIDILVIGEDGDRNLKVEVSGIIGDIDLKNFTATSLVYLTRSAFTRYIQGGSPFLETVLEESVVLHDRGTFQQVCRSFVKASE